MLLANRVDSELLLELLALLGADCGAVELARSLLHDAVVLLELLQLLLGALLGAGVDLRLRDQSELLLDLLELLRAHRRTEVNTRLLLRLHNSELLLELLHLFLGTDCRSVEDLLLLLLLELGDLLLLLLGQLLRLLRSHLGAWLCLWLLCKDLRLCLWLLRSLRAAGALKDDLAGADFCFPDSLADNRTRRLLHIDGGREGRCHGRRDGRGEGVPPDDNPLLLLLLREGAERSSAQCWERRWRREHSRMRNRWGWRREEWRRQAALLPTSPVTATVLLVTMAIGLGHNQLPDEEQTQQQRPQHERGSSFVKGPTPLKAAIYVASATLIWAFIR